ncbi:zeta toxin family protein [Chitinophaga sp. sic0106]|uniref:zeta toxin family protein n=1 Tax=Chitinophaga sp. sic0106 TaxID=2854785 RepID=UPI001C47940A|nr:zeta toxin family protein [Chitinophaga sp. sic0106]MBV7529269.1 zeta toxin family protein [Chitinophaga sp. sic0106]
MDYSKPTLLVISGPNGAGKSTHIDSMLPELFDGVPPFDRDLTRTTFEKELQGKGLTPEEISSQSSLMMEDYLSAKINEAISNRQHFVLETPLSHPDYWRYIDRFENAGYQIQLNYLCLDSILDCEQRVRQRVKEGGHAVDARTIKGVYEQNLKFINDYWETFNVICLYDGMAKPTLLVKLEDKKVAMVYKDALKKGWVKKGLINIFNLVRE